MYSKRHSVLVVDDTPENIDVLVGVLSDEYKVSAAVSGEYAIKAVNVNPPDIILLDVMMPGMDGFEVCRVLKNDTSTSHIPIVFVTAKIGVDEEIYGFEIGAVDYISKPISPPIVLTRVRTHLALYDQNCELDRLVREKTKRLETARFQIVQKLGRAASYRDSVGSNNQPERVAHFAKILGLASGMSLKEVELLYEAAPMFDIGKIGIPDHILGKNGRLTAEEMEVVKSHCKIGGEILDNEDSDLLKLAHLIAMTHHEHWDGSGYPGGLAGEDIPLPGRIMGIVNVFDALTTKRPYKDEWPIDEAVSTIESLAGSHFEPKLVELFLDKLPAIIEVKEKYHD